MRVTGLSRPTAPAPIPMPTAARTPAPATPSVPRRAPAAPRAAAPVVQRAPRAATPATPPTPHPPPTTRATPKSAKWISSIQTGIRRPTAQIRALRADGSEVARWGLIDVLPVSWQGPSLNPANPAVATEVLEITHHGFTD
ncbi:phage tail protein [Streptomyces litchfieldiae]|uniref:Phage tail protein n=1 Tax=Streptomyces litchfieldiae TaxID=3075543 RepID=A0ABU2MK26_9ACTN|nr:phage tail protein [Streptomyces sp. DSM 44938]MDT0341459.1 phage tail protein [Streptomyces sp. DSM 44938]